MKNKSVASAHSRIRLYWSRISFVLNTTCDTNCYRSASFLERWLVHFDIASTSRWPTKRRIAMRTMESNTECSNHSTIGHFIIERTEHIFTCERWCVRYVSQMAWFSRKRQWISEYYKVKWRTLHRIYIYIWNDQFLFSSPISFRQKTSTRCKSWSWKRRHCSSVNTRGLLYKAKK